VRKRSPLPFLTLQIIGALASGSPPWPDAFFLPKRSAKTYVTLGITHGIINGIIHGIARGGFMKAALHV
jgi:hypothetical protein